jgi:hypothetical protein
MYRRDGVAAVSGKNTSAGRIRGKCHLEKWYLYSLGMTAGFGSPPKAWFAQARIHSPKFLLIYFNGCINLIFIQ